MNKIIKNISGMLLGGSLVLGLSACTGKFEDFNTDPNAPTPEQMQGDNAASATLIANQIPMALVQGQENNAQMLDMMIGNEYGGMISNKNAWGTDAYYATYNPNSGWTGNTFDTMMPNIMNPYFQIKRITEGKGIVYHWSTLLRVIGMLKISDTYGPIPYSKVTGSEFAVAYDDMPTLYSAMIADLETALEGLKEAASSPSDVNLFENTDYIFQGDFRKWVKLGNTIKLRIALRLANVDPNKAKALAEEAVADSYGLLSEPTETAWSTFITQRNPFNLIGESWGEIRVSANITAYMNGYSDPRLPVYAKPASDGSYTGARNGVFHFENEFANASQVNLGAQDKLLAIAASESWFCRAEGALRGWAMGGTAKELYEQGVKVSMQERGVDVGNYLESEATMADHVSVINSSYNVTAVSSVTPKYDESASFDQNLERILVQKWLGNFPNGWETWVDFRRTNYPKFFPVYNNLSTDGVTTRGGMRRLPYPLSEFNTNEKNVKAAQAMLNGPDNSATNLWWATPNF